MRKTGLRRLAAMGLVTMAVLSGCSSEKASDSSGAANGTGNEGPAAEAAAPAHEPV